MRISGISVAMVNVRGWDGSAWQNLVLDANSGLIVNVGGRSALANGQVGMTASAAQIVAANTSRKSLSIKNIGTEDVEIGAAGVTFGTGYRLGPGESLDEIRTTAAIQGICNTGKTSTVCYWED